ncbi:hypothetical protein L873DRAFT_71871 [Choiromyces venosus 120613-1]|uniref:Uncharacterized protein n=1 Tax=Choiromyces venosus 120613-1 TaxID=1336337 RepID=A0A3N4J4U7_9PEZI|nr:hypothetical protein L873DRAFT_71871 [Choiromyces venosus 120613-1]
MEERGGQDIQSFSTLPYSTPVPVLVLSLFVLSVCTRLTPKEDENHHPLSLSPSIPLEPYPIPVCLFPCYHFSLSNSLFSFPCQPKYYFFIISLVFSSFSPCLPPCTVQYSTALPLPDFFPFPLPFPPFPRLPRFPHHSFNALSFQERTRRKS